MFRTEIAIKPVLIYFLLGALCLSSLGLFSCIAKPRIDNPDPYREPDHLIILEVFYTGSLLEQKKTWGRPGKKKTVITYRHDDTNPYIKIHNPTKEVKYLDGLGIATSAFSPTSPITFDNPEEDFTKEYTAVLNVVHFPGTGKDYPIKPGETKILTNVAVDHTKGHGWDEEYKTYLQPANSNSFDLSNADFEWLSADDLKDNSEFEGFQENPKVPNLIRTFIRYGQNASYFKVDHSRALMLIDFPKEAFEEGDNLGKLYRRYEYTWQSSVGNKIANQVAGAYVIPNTSIIDAVVICPNEEYAFNPVPKNIDSGWAGASSRYQGSDDVKHRTDLNKAICRIYDGKNWVDTNNSVIDFHVVDASNTKDYSKPIVTNPFGEEDIEEEF